MDKKHLKYYKFLQEMKDCHGDLNTALVREYIFAYGMASERSISQDVGLSRSVVRRVIQEWYKSDQ